MPNLHHVSDLKGKLLPRKLKPFRLRPAEELRAHWVQDFHSAHVYQPDGWVCVVDICGVEYANVSDLYGKMGFAG
jgi:hypothetical protein